VYCTYITILVQDAGEPFEDLIKISKDMKDRGYRVEITTELADGRKQIMLTAAQRIIPKSDIVIDAIKIIEKIQREGD
jgi:c-di-GMP-related signal transduction protein